jgi:hypothetical protein
MILGISDVADHMPFRSAPSRNGRVDINSPALRAVRRKQRWIVLGVFATTNEQHLAAATRDSGDQITLHVDTIRATGNPKISKPRVEAAACASRQKHARHPAPKTASCPLVDIHQTIHSYPFILMANPASIHESLLMVFVVFELETGGHVVRCTHAERTSVDFLAG